MKKIAVLPVAVTAMLVALLPAAPARAVVANSKLVSFISSTGSDSNPCSRAAPCQTLAGAVIATIPGGEIQCLDSGDFSGAGTGSPINKSLTIDCRGTPAKVRTASAVGPAVIVVDGAGIVVNIRNLSIEGLGSGAAIGIDFRNGAALFVENCVIQNFNGSTPFVGIRFQPAAPGSQLVVTDTELSNNGAGSAGGGIIVNPQSGGNAQVALNRVTVGKNVFGIVADGTGSSGGISMTVTDSVSSGNSQDGIIAVTPSGGAPIGVLVTNTKSVNNNIGIRSIGPNVTVRVKNSDITGNGTGLSFSSGGALLTFGNNAVRANGSDGAFSGSVGLQ